MQKSGVDSRGCMLDTHTCGGGPNKRDIMLKTVKVLKAIKMLFQTNNRNCYLVSASPCDAEKSSVME